MVLHIHEIDRRPTLVVSGLPDLPCGSNKVGVKKVNGSARVVMTNGVDMNTSWQTTSTGNEVAGADVSGTKIWLRVEADVRSSGGGTATFSYSTDGAQFESLGDTLTMNEDWQFFMGYRFGIFNYATEALGGSVKVLSFEAKQSSRASHAAEPLPRLASGSSTRASWNTES